MVALDDRTKRNPRLSSLKLVHLGVFSENSCKVNSRTVRCWTFEWSSACRRTCLRTCRRSTPHCVTNLKLSIYIFKLKVFTLITGNRYALKQIYILFIEFLESNFLNFVENWGVLNYLESLLENSRREFNGEIPVESCSGV